MWPATIPPNVLTLVLLSLATYDSYYFSSTTYSLLSCLPLRPFDFVIAVINNVQKKGVTKCRWGWYDATYTVSSPFDFLFHLETNLLSLLIYSGHLLPLGIVGRQLIDKLLRIFVRD